MKTIKQLLRSVELCLSAHPDNVPDSEFEDRISDLQKLPKMIEFEAEKQRIEGVLLGLKICKEMWGQGTISHENIYENEVCYREALNEMIEEHHNKQNHEQEKVKNVRKED